MARSAHLQIQSCSCIYPCGKLLDAHTVRKIRVSQGRFFLCGGEEKILKKMRQESNTVIAFCNILIFELCHTDENKRSSDSVVS